MEKRIPEIGWNFDNSFTHLPKSFFSNLNPTPVCSPKIVAFNESLAAVLGLDAGLLQGGHGAAVFAGNKLPSGAEPIALAYAGHQFGHFTMLGDGRAILLGEQLTPSGERFDIQLKGSGRTPYSRGGDGRAALGPMLREYIISEAMHALGIATTRSLAVVTTGEPVFRQDEQPGAILTRVASSHLRIGTFEYVSKWGTAEELRILADYALHRHFEGFKAIGNKYIFLLKQVVMRQAELIAKWQLVGFIHGVMNTDNMAISGETIDYGPCAFMDTYDPATVFSSIDIHGRYAYGNQPGIAGWNLERFAVTLLPLLHDDNEQAVKIAREAISDFVVLYENNWLEGMRAKLGLTHRERNDKTLVDALLDMMHKYGADYTNTFRALSLEQPEDTVLFGKEEFAVWYEQWQARLGSQQEKTGAYRLMRNSNPAVIPRNHRVEAALEAAVKLGDYSVAEKLLDVLTSPYEYSPEQDEYSKLPEPTSCHYRTFCGT